jgi:hypothetical protein
MAGADARKISVIAPSRLQGDGATEFRHFARLWRNLQAA